MDGSWGEEQKGPEGHERFPLKCFEAQGCCGCIVKTWHLPQIVARDAIEWAHSISQPIQTAQAAMMAKAIKWVHQVGRPVRAGQCSPRDAW